jgi:hypothetical protein
LESVKIKKKVEENNIFLDHEPLDFLFTLNCSFHFPAAVNATTTASSSSCLSALDDCEASPTCRLYLGNLRAKCQPPATPAASKTAKNKLLAAVVPKCPPREQCARASDFIDFFCLLNKLFIYFTYNLLNIYVDKSEINLKIK